MTKTSTPHGSFSIHRWVVLVATVVLLRMDTGHAQSVSGTGDAPADSIVQITAEAEGLTRIDPTTLPLIAACWWTVFPNTGPVPMPCPPEDLSVPIYEITDGIYLVDQTGGAISMNISADGAQTVDGSAVATAVDTQGNAVANLIEQVQATQFSSSTMTMATAMDIPSPGDPGSGTNSYTPNDASYVQPDYGTNLWLTQSYAAAGYLGGIGSNTIANVQYEIQSRTNLMQTDWQSEGFIYGDELTNWTALSIIQGGRTNLFLRLKSWASTDGSGIPDWWEAQYGLTNVNPDALDSVGDGWTIIQKFQLGVSPNSWVTPAAPQGVTVDFHQASKTAAISWLPARGSVSEYVVEKTDSYGANFCPPVVTDSTVSAAGTSYVDDISGNTPDPIYGYTYDLTYRVKAIYANGNSSEWSVPVGPQTTVSASVAPGANGATYLRVAGVPTNAATVRLVFVDQFSYTNFIYDAEYNFTQDYPVSAFTNGVIPLTTLWPTQDGSGEAFYRAFVKSVAANGDESAATWFDVSYSDTPQPYNWGQAFYDARVQLKQDLIFQLRAAPLATNFNFDLPGTNNYDPGTFGGRTGWYKFPASYVYAGLYPFTPFYSSVDATYLDPYLPYEENALFGNFVYGRGNVDDNGSLITGASADYQITSLSRWPAYQFQTNGMPLPNLLGNNDTRWLFFNVSEDSVDSDPYSAGLVNSDDNTFIVSMNAGLRNWFGLPYLSANFAYQNYDANNNPLGFVSRIVNAGESVSLSEDEYFSLRYSGGPQNIYFETAQPQFETVKYCFYRARSDWLPGSAAFTPTNDSPLRLAGDSSAAYFATNDLPFVIVPVGGYTQIAGYAKLAILNGYPGVYGYLGQYFDTAYKVDDSGIVTTNVTGIVSPYGSYLATEAGIAALVTMPDVDPPYQRGTCMVYSVSLALDKNHDGTMDLSYYGPDTTSTNSPYIFWCNNNYDRSARDSDDATNYDDDVSAAAAAAQSPYTHKSTPDFDYRQYDGSRVIPTLRDLEDFAPLWICGVGSDLQLALPTNSTIALSWGDVGHPNTNNPTIDLFVAADPNGGLGYLTNLDIGQAQRINSTTLWVGRLGPGQSIPIDRFGDHLIWCGVTNGTGALTLTIFDGNNNILAQSAAYIKIVDIKQMYERWSVGDDPQSPPTNTAYLASTELPPGITPFEFPRSQDTNTPYILFVHGWNMTPYDKDRFAESAFKRLYWQGYQGRFGAFRWPTEYNFKGIVSMAIDPTEKDNFDRSENHAWLSGLGLLDKLTDLNGKYPGHVYLLAHSMGNIVAGEALRLSGGTTVVNTYVASQAAVSAHTYDTNIENYSFVYFAYGIPLSLAPDTPNIYGNWFVGNNGGGASQVVSFYNPNDFALQRSVWQLNQLLKPDFNVMEGDRKWNYDYSGSSDDPPPWNNFYKKEHDLNFNVTLDIVGVLTNRYEVMALDAQSWTTAFGATPGIRTIIRNVDLTQLWPPDSVHPAHAFVEHFYHSAEFRGDYWSMRVYWAELLGPDAFNLK